MPYRGSRGREEETRADGAEGRAGFLFLGGRFWATARKEGEARSDRVGGGGRMDQASAPQDQVMGGSAACKVVRSAGVRRSGPRSLRRRCRASGQDGIAGGRYFAAGRGVLTRGWATLQTGCTPRSTSVLDAVGMSLVGRGGCERRSPAGRSEGRGTGLGQSASLLRCGAVRCSADEAQRSVQCSAGWGRSGALAIPEWRRAQRGRDEGQMG